MPSWTLSKGINALFLPKDIQGKTCHQYTLTSGKSGFHSIYQWPSTSISYATWLCRVTLCLHLLMESIQGVCWHSIFPENMFVFLRHNRGLLWNDNVIRLDVLDHEIGDFGIFWNSMAKYYTLWAFCHFSPPCSNKSVRSPSVPMMYVGLEKVWSEVDRLPENDRCLEIGDFAVLYSPSSSAILWQTRATLIWQNRPSLKHYVPIWYACG